MKKKRSMLVSILLFALITLTVDFLAFSKTGASSQKSSPKVNSSALNQIGSLQYRIKSSTKNYDRNRFIVIRKLESP